jgi:hypothetical protein
MKMRSIIMVLALTTGCDTVYRHNTVYQLDVAEHQDTTTEYVFVDTGLTAKFKANNCTTDHYGDMQPYNIRPKHCEAYDGGYCCSWVTEFSSEHVCMEEWCYREDMCEWDLTDPGWGEQCYLIPGNSK